MSAFSRRNAGMGRGVSFRLPMTPTAPRPAPVARQRQAAAPGASRYAQMAANMANAAGEKEEEEEGGGWGRGLGVVINNPLTRNLLEPLKVIDIPRRGVAVASEEWAKFAPEWAEGALPPSMLVDEEKARLDERDLGEKLWSDDTYGWGQLTGDTGNKWLDRGIGFAGDIAFDPLTYLTAGAAPIAKGTATAGRGARLGRVAEATEKLRQLELLDDDTINVLRQVAQRGYHKADRPVVRRALGVQDSGLRFEIPFTNKSTGVIPGTGAIADAINAPIGGVRGAFNNSARGQRMLKTRTPQALEKAMPILTSETGTNDDFRRATQVLRQDQARRRGEGVFRALGSKELRSRKKAIETELQTKYGGDVNAYLRATEVDPDVETEINKLAKRMIEIADQQLDVELPELQGMGYVPHLLSRDFRQMLNGQDTAAIERFMQQAGIRNLDTLRDAGFLNQRALTPGKTLELPGGGMAEIKTGDIAELNEIMARAFPELEGTALETNPMALFERYIEQTAYDVGNRYAQKQMPDAFHRVEGLGETLEVEHGVNPWADDEFLRPGLNQQATKDVNARIAGRLKTQLESEQGRANVIRDTVAREASDLSRPMRDELGEQVRDASTGINRAERRMAELGPETGTLRAERQIVDQELTAKMRSLRSRVGALTKQIKRVGDDAEASVREGAQQRLEQLQREFRAISAEADDAQGLANMLGREAESMKDFAAAREELARGVREAQEAYDVAYRNIYGEAGIGPKPVAQAGPPRPAGGQPNQQRIAAARAAIMEQEIRTSRAAAAASAKGAGDAEKKALAAARRKEKKLRKALEQIEAEEGRKSFTTPTPTEDTLAPGVRAANREAAESRRAAGEAREFAESTPVETPANRRARGARRAEATRAERVADATAEAAQATRREREEALTNLRRLKRQIGLEEGRRLRIPVEPAAAAREGLDTSDEWNLIQQDLIPTGIWDAMFPGRTSETGEFIRTRPEDVSLNDFYNALLSRFDKGGSKTAARRAAKLRSLQQRSGARLADEAVRGPARTEGLIPAERYGATQGLRAERRALQQRVDNVKAIHGAEMSRIDEEIAGNYDEYAELLTNKDEMRKARHEARQALDALPVGKDPARRLEASSGGLRSPTSKTKGLDPSELTPEQLAEYQPLISSIDAIEEMVRLNPNLDDETLTAAEALLQQHRRHLGEATRADMKAQDVKKFLDKATGPGLVDVVSAQIDESIWKVLPNQPDVVMAKELAEMMQNIVKLKGQPTLLGQTLTAFTNFFKTYATLSPGFHVRNAISATFMNAADGVPLRQQTRGIRLWQQFMNADDPLAWLQRQPQSVQDAFQATTGSGAGGRFFESGVAETTAIGRTRLKEGIFRNRATEGSQKLGERVEGAVRLGMALDTIENGGTINQALDRITRIHFDYSQVSNFDEGAKKLIPFWTFMSRNLPMQISEMWMKPRLYNQYQSFVRNASVEPAAFTPEYILMAGGFDTGAETPEGVWGTSANMPIFLQPDLAHSRVTEDLERFGNIAENPGGVLSDFNPFFTAPIEYATGKDLFTGRVYQEDDYRKMGGPLDAALLPLMWAMGQTEEGADGRYVSEKGFDAVKSLLPPLDRISRLAPQTTGGEMNDRQLESYLRFIGVPIRTVSDEQRRNEQRSRYYDQLDELRLQQVLAGGR